MDGSCQERGGENFTDSGSGRNETGMGLGKGGGGEDRFFYGGSESRVKGVEKDL